YATLSNNDDGDWHLLNYSTYFLIQPNANLATVSDKLNAAYKTYASEELKEITRLGLSLKFIWGLQPFLQMHLDDQTANEGAIYDESKPIYSYILTGIALFILLIACINFVNLTVAQSLKRSKEVGLRKVVGSSRAQLIRQFLGESFALCFIAFVLAFILVQALLPLFNELANKKLSLSYLLDLPLIISFVGLFLLTSFAAGFYPAIVMSGFRPAESFKSQSLFNSKNYLSKSLVVLQFALATFLITSTLFIYFQYNFLTHSSLGYNDKNLLVVNINTEGRNKQLLKLFKTEFSSIPGVLSIAERMNGNWNTGAKVDGKDIDINYAGIDESYLSTLEIPLVQGRNFSKDFPSDSANSVIVNEAFVKTLGWSDPIGRTINFLNWEER